MAFADSKPVFKDRATSAGLSEEVHQHLTNSGLDTLSKFAFKTLKTVLNRDATLSELASFRKLLHESYSLVTQEMKQQLERSEDVTARKLTPEPARSLGRAEVQIAG